MLLGKRAQLSPAVIITCIGIGCSAFAFGQPHESCSLPIAFAAMNQPAQDFQTVLNRKEDCADAHIGLGEAEEALGQEVSCRRAHAIDPHSISWALSELESYYPFADKVDLPAKNNYRTNLEGLMGYPRRELMAPIPLATDGKS
jgi:hypothetical protein